MDTNTLTELIIHEIPINLVREVPNLEIMQIDPDLEKGNTWVWKCGKYTSNTFDNPLSALYDFLAESADIWASD